MTHKQEKTKPECRLLRYFGFGLPIISALPLPELEIREDERRPEVRIRAGVVPPELEGCTGRGAFFQVSPGSFLLRMDGVASYWAENGHEITVDAAPKAPGESVRLFLLGPVFSALLQQRGLIVLHASAILTAKGAVLFAGASGTGKSALAAIFYSRGYSVIADEVCALETNFSGTFVLPAFPRLLLWSDVIEESGLEGENIRPARPRLKKYHVPAETGFVRNPSLIHAVYSLRVTNGKDFHISRLAGLEKFQELGNATFRRICLSGDSAAARYFSALSSAARRIPVSRLARPSTRSLRETADLLERDFSL